MGFYSRVVFPRVVDMAMSTDSMREARSALLAEVSGEVFEIGFGTGLNLKHYPPSIQKITTADPNPGMSKRAQRRIAKSGIEVVHHRINAESLPFDDDTFDSVVCAWTLCSIHDPMKALAEVRRVLRPHGRFFFVEHGLADDPKIRKWQDRITPVWKLIGDGCHLNRNAREMIQDAHFNFTQLDTYYMKEAPRIAGFMYQGVATKT